MSWAKSRSKSDCREQRVGIPYSQGSLVGPPHGLSFNVSMSNTQMGCSRTSNSSKSCRVYERDGVFVVVDVSVVGAVALVEEAAQAPVIRHGVFWYRHSRSRSSRSSGRIRLVSIRDGHHASF
jgi:hypothetical protein